MRALLSVYDKRGLDELARGLDELGAELVASGGTAAHLEGMALPVSRVEDLTEVPELLGGRVKTLHPRVHAGILARRDRSEDLASLEEHKVPPFDLVCVNLYPFAQAAATSTVTREDLLELIDIGGSALLRAAAKNHAHVGAVCRPERYSDVLGELRETGSLSAETRRSLAAEAFATTAAYDAEIARWFSREERLPNQLTLALVKERDLAYGENPHQRAAFYVERGASAHVLSGVEQLHGRELSATNVLDLSTARLLLADLGEEPACVIVKHVNPCGVAVAPTIEEAYERALACDPVSAFGMVCALNRPVGAELGLALAERLVDVLLAPAYDEPARDTLTAKPGTRLLAGGDQLADDLDLKRVPGGLVVQEPDSTRDDALSTGPSDAHRADLLLAWRVCRHVTSNAIVLAKDGRTLGIGAGQVSRVDAVRIAVDKARRHGHDLHGAVLASDGFFPFPDGPQLALDASIEALVQPGGSKRDAEVVAAVEAAGAAMILTGVRHFRH